MAIGVINHGRRRDKPWASLWKTMAMEIHNHGDGNL